MIGSVRERPVLVAPPDVEASIPPLLAMLGCLDRLLDAAVAKLSPPGAAADRFRGLHIGADDVARATARQVGAPHLSTCAAELPWLELACRDPRLGYIVDRHGLDAFQVATLAIAFAPELDLRYETLYAFLQDDVRRKQPSPDLVLSLLCETPQERLRRRQEFAPGGPLLAQNLINMAAGADRSSLSGSIELDAQVLHFLLGDHGLAPSLQSWCRRIADPGPGDVVLGAAVENALRATAAQSRGGLQTRLYLTGRDGSGREAAAGRLAELLGRPLLVADLAALLATAADPGSALTRLGREAVLGAGLLLLREVEAFDEAAPPHLRRGLDELLAHAPLLAVAGAAAAWAVRKGAGLRILAVETDDPEQRRLQWRRSLIRAGLGGHPEDCALLAERLRLTAGAINAAASAAAALETSPDAPEPVDALFAAARAQGGRALASLATRVELRDRWGDLVLPADPLAQLHELRDTVLHRRRVMRDWGFGQRLSTGCGVTALFVGPSGTGKTMAAGVIAHELRLDLYRIDLSRVVNKYIGETEKNLDSVFAAAQDANAILFFDEADALFGKRAEVRDARDRYANLEISYLLQKMEAFEGVAVLATNLHQNLDDAFLRRLGFVVHFPFPQAEDRERIWRAVAPAAVPMAADVDFASLARRFRLSGGNIRNIVLAASHRAAAEDGPVRQAHLLHATRREFQKLGKQLTDAELAQPEAAA